MTFVQKVRDRPAAKLKQVSPVFKKVQDGGTNNKKPAESIGCTAKEAEMIRKQFGIQIKSKTGNQGKNFRPDCTGERKIRGNIRPGTEPTGPAPMYESILPTLPAMSPR